MACIDDKGALTPAAQRLVLALREPSTAEEAAGRTDLPLFRIRSSMRELIAAELVTEADGRYTATEEALTRASG